MGKDISRENQLWVIAKKVFKAMLDFSGIIILAFVIWLLFLVSSESNHNEQIAFSVLRNISWPVTLIVFGLIFLVPIYQLLMSLADKLSSATTVKIWDIEFHTETIEKIIVEREILRTGIYMASVDAHLSEPEFLHLKSEEEKFPNRLDDLDTDGRLEILQAAIRMANADQDLQVREYEALKNLAGKFEILKERLDWLIVEAVLDSYVRKKEVKISDDLRELNSKLAEAKSTRHLI